MKLKTLTKTIAITLLFATPLVTSANDVAGLTYDELKNIKEVAPVAEKVEKLEKKAEGIKADSKDLLDDASKKAAEKEDLAKNKADLAEKETSVSAEIADLRQKIESKKKEIEAEKIAAQQKEGLPYFGPDGLLVMQASERADHVLYLLHKIPGHANGAWAHQEWGIDTLIDQLTIEEATWVIHRAEGAGFGQTGAGYAGVDSPETHQAFLQQQVINRFKNEPGEMGIYSLLKAWGTFHYPGY